MADAPAARPLLRRLAWIGIALALVWVAFLDGHSLAKRAGYAAERAALRAEVETLRAENETLAERVAVGLSDDLIEAVAREQYGMRRSGETVYPVEHVGR